MEAIRSDLAAEIVELKKVTERDGVEIREFTCDGIRVTRVRILSEQGAKKTGKPVGSYVTVDFEGAFTSDETHTRAVDVLAGQLRSFIGDEPEEKILLVGLGNPALTSDAVGPRTVDGVIITRHIKSNLPKIYSSMPLRETSAFLPGVLGRTGMESAQTVGAVIREIKPDIAVVIDALASRSAKRLCSTVQISDTGICPGSGVGNSRNELNRKTLGIPVISVGIPTVVDAATLAAGLTGEEDGDKIRRALTESGSEDMILTPRDIDTVMNRASRLLSMALNKALHGELSQEEINALLD